MLQLVVLVLNEVNYLEPVIEAWEKAGAGGITVLHSTGSARLRNALVRDDVPMFPTLRDLMEHDDLHHRTIFTVADGDDLVDRLIAASEEIIGDFDTADTGLLFTVPVSRAVGMLRRDQTE